MDLGLAGKVAIVAGGSRGCGRGVSEVLAQEGARVVLSGRLGAKVEGAVEAIRAAGGEATGVVADITSEAGCAALIAAARSAYGEADILVVNSPGPFPDPETNRGRGFDNCPDDLFAEVHRDFVMSQVWLTRAVAPAMKAKGWGRLVNLGSIAMKVPHQEDPMPAVNTRVAVAAPDEEPVPGVRTLWDHRQHHRHRPLRERALAGVPGLRNRREDRRVVPRHAAGPPLGPAGGDGRAGGLPLPSSARPTPASSPARRSGSTAATRRACSRRGHRPPLTRTPAPKPGGAPGRGGPRCARRA